MCDVLSDSGASSAGPSKSVLKKPSAGAKVDEWKQLRRQLAKPCACAALRIKRRRHEDGGQSGGSCFEYFQQPGGWRALCDWRLSFSNMHKLDQDKLAPGHKSDVLQKINNHAPTPFQSAEVFDLLRELALSQGLLDPGTIVDEGRRPTEKMQYLFLGQHVCKAGFATLLGVGWNPRLQTLFAAVCQGHKSAPIDRRFMSRPLGDPRPMYGEVCSYLEQLYHSVAETLPFEHRKHDVASEDEDEFGCSLPSKPSEQLRYLPPGSMYDTWRQFREVSGTTCSWHCFHKAWTEQFSHKLAFRGQYVFAVCAVCVKHKLMIRKLAGDATARHKQRLLYDRHLASQFADRRVYWADRSASRLRDKTICIAIDGMDQGKFAVPRSGFFRGGHLFQKFTRPRLHIWGVLVHGVAAFLSISDADVSKGGSTTAEIVMHVLFRLRKAGITLRDKTLVLQLDNTSSSNKNNIVLALGGVVAGLQIVQRFRVQFLRCGHTHEERRDAIVVDAGLNMSVLPVARTSTNGSES